MRHYFFGLDWIGISLAWILTIASQIGWGSEPYMHHACTAARCCSACTSWPPRACCPRLPPTAPLLLELEVQPRQSCYLSCSGEVAHKVFVKMTEK